jgi:zinc protease
MIASIAAGELMKGTARRTKLELAEDLESRAASLSFSSDASDPVGVDVTGAALSRDTDLLIDTLAEVLRTPTFPRDELDKEKKRLVGAIRQQQEQTSMRAYEAAMRRIYPLAHPMHRLTGAERIARVEALDRADLEAFYRERYGAASLAIVVVGDVDAGRVLDRLETGLEPWAAGPSTGITAPPIPAPSPGEETVRMPDKANADVVLALPANLARTDPEFLACSLAEEKSARIGRFKVDLGSNAGIAQALDAAIYYGFGVGYLDVFAQKVAAVTKAEADAGFSARVRPEAFTVVSAGTFPS